MTETWHVLTVSLIGHWRRERRAFADGKDRQAQALALKRDVQRHRHAVDRAVAKLHAARFVAFGDPAESKRVSRRLETLADEIRRGLDTYGHLPRSSDEARRPTHFPLLRHLRTDVIEGCRVPAATVARFVAARLTPDERQILSPSLTRPMAQQPGPAGVLLARRLQRAGS